MRTAVLSPPGSGLVAASPLTGEVTIVEATDGAPGRLRAVFAVSPDEPVLAGHYPNFPIFPGVCLLECAHLAIGALARRRGVRARLAEVASTRFVGPVFPGDRVDIDVTLTEAGDLWRARARLSSPRGRAVEARLVYRVGETGTGKERAGAGGAATEESATEEPATESTAGEAHAGESHTGESHTGDPAAPAARRRSPAEVLPHRYPILLVDRVAEIVPGRRIVAVKAVSRNEPWYAKEPVATATDGTTDAAAQRSAYPPMLVVESWCQAAGVMVAWDAPNPDVLDGAVMLFGGIADVRFLADVEPGDLLEHHVSLTRALSDTVIVEGFATVAGRRVLDVGRVVMALRPAALVRPAGEAP